jgi:HAD superfamily hydrolase (TIGR01509 family)
MKKIKNIIFDLGGVILNLDFKKTELAFAALGIGNFNEYYTLQTATPLFENLEIGKISTGVFYDEFRKLVKTQLTNDEIMHAWNAMLLDFPPERIEWLKEIKSRYNIYLLSNTNEIHYNSFINTFKQQIGNYNFDDLFIKAYYSHKIGLRKPSREIFEAVLKKENLQSAETLFIDDSVANIEAAKLIGVQTIHLPSPKTILELDL